MNLRGEKKLITVIYIITVLFWIVFVLASNHTATYEGLLFHYILKPFLVGMTIIPLLGGIIGLVKAKRWGGWQSSMGRAISSLSIGMLTWSGGMIVWNYYLFFTDVEVPYPSFADALFILSWFFWPYGILQLSKAIGTKVGLRTKRGKVALVVLSLLALFISYYLLIVIARGGTIDFSVRGMQLFFDLFYPLGDVVILILIAVVYSLSRKYLGGQYKTPIIVLFIGFLLNYLSDFIFSYTTSTEVYFNGHFVDFLFTTTMFVLSFGISNLDIDLVQGD